MPGLLDELEATVTTIGTSIAPSVVRIGKAGGRGAGVVIGDGKVLTNAHNLRGEETTVTFADGRSATGTVTGIDADGDLAVLTVDTAGAPSIRWSPSDVDPKVGAAVFAVANPAGRGQRVTFGLISAVGQAFRGPHGRRIAGSIEHTAPLNRGSSGGPIVDASGSLVGINTNRVGDGFYLALPADADLAARITALGEGRSPSRPRLGVALAPSHAARRLRAAVGLPPRDGLLIRGVEEGSAGDTAGLRQGDLLVSAGGRDLTSMDDLFEALVAPGSIVLGVVRGVEELSITVELA
jgi:S1-C subfamily serine protease